MDVLEKRKNYYLKNRDKILKQRKEYYLRNRDKILQQNKEYYHNNREERKKYNNQYWEEHKEKYMKARSKNNEYKTQHRLYYHNYYKIKDLVPDKKIQMKEIKVHNNQNKNLTVYLN